MTASNSLGTTASKILYSSLVDQLYAEGVNFCSFVRKSNQDVFNSFYRTVTGGKFHRIIFKEIDISSNVTAQFSALVCTSPQKSPKQVHVI